MIEQNDPTASGLGEAGVPNEDLDDRERRLGKEHEALAQRAAQGGDVSADMAQIAADEADVEIERMHREAEAKDPGRQ